MFQNCIHAEVFSQDIQEKGWGVYSEIPVDNTYAKNLLTSSAVMASYTVGISFQIWQNINIQTIAREIRVSLFSVACIACC